MRKYLTLRVLRRLQSVEHMDSSFTKYLREHRSFVMSIYFEDKISREIRDFFLDERFVHRGHEFCNEITSLLPLQLFKATEEASCLCYAMWQEEGVVGS